MKKLNFDIMIKQTNIKASKTKCFKISVNKRQAWFQRNENKN